jgi:Aromatic-ring-opening dioxygenase LigAB, LigA subunit
MSVNILERVLWDLTVNADCKRRFRDDADKLLARYRLEPEERDMVRGLDVRRLAQIGVSPLLTMGFWMESTGNRDSAVYLQRMRGEDAGG